MTRVAVLGDLIVDHTVYVEPSKIAQEAPIVAYRVLDGEEFTHGGAGAVSDMLQALGVKAELPLVKIASNIPITRKMRYVCRGSRNPAIVARFDVDVEFQWTEDIYAGLMRRLEEYAPDVIIVSDYGKGFVTQRLMTELYRLCITATVIADPYTSDWSKYERTADIMVPSRAAAANFLATNDYRGMSAVITKLDRDGCRLYGTGPMHEFASAATEIVDVTGAGDQFIATLAANLSPGKPLRDAVWLANIAAGMQCQRMGVKPVTADELRIRVAQMGEMLLASA